MVRVTCAPASRRRRKRWLKRAKGFWGDRKNHIRQTKDAVMKAMSFSTEHRKQKKSDFRSLWITRVGVAAKMRGISYSRLMDGLKKANCPLNRKMLSELAIHDPEGFTSIVEVAKSGFKL
ncbi:MAG: 50S ribosomal protein L20 [Chlamydiia bacterium]|nr:50S ribosomal protein L20 [Chlamydiia bacterium]